MIETDDLLYRVDSRYLGPAGKTFPFPIRYQAVGVGSAVFIALLLIVRGLVHVPANFTMWSILLVATGAITSRITRITGADRPLSSVVRAAWNDLNAPRPPRPGQAVAIQLPPRARHLHGQDGTPTTGEVQ
ncbi:hypothetical protein [Nocardia tengchongensis]|uniref:hypothetical protein n=1 Tax=Nocardia tengchongensis TaxID=2055889 RepID=UPI00364F145F